MPVNAVFESGLPEREREEQTVHVLSPKVNGRIDWNGEPVMVAELREHLRLGLYEDTEPLVVFAPDGNASYDLAAQVLGVVKESGITKFCFGGLEAHRHFGREDTPYRLDLTILPPKNSEPIVPHTEPPRCSLPPETLELS